MQRTVAQIPWRSNLTLLEKLKEPELRLWYAEQTIINGWSKNILAVQIETELHKRIGQTANNFEVTLPPDDSDMANQIFKDPYLFDFLGTAEVRKEAELENKLIEHLEKLLGDKLFREYRTEKETLLREMAFIKKIQELGIGILNN